MDESQVKKSVTITVISVIVSFVAFINITKKSNLKTIEILIILALGMGITALIYNLAQLFKSKKNPGI